MVKCLKTIIRQEQIDKDGKDQEIRVLYSIIEDEKAAISNYQKCCSKICEVIMPEGKPSGIHCNICQEYRLMEGPVDFRILGECSHVCCVACVQTLTANFIKENPNAGDKTMECPFCRKPCYGITKKIFFN